MTIELDRPNGWTCRCGHPSIDHQWGDDDKGSFGDICEQPDCDCRELVPADDEEAAS